MPRIYHTRKPVRGNVGFTVSACGLVYHEHSEPYALLNGNVAFYFYIGSIPIIFPVVFGVFKNFPEALFFCFRYDRRNELFIFRVVFVRRERAVSHIGNFLAVTLEKIRSSNAVVGFFLFGFCVRGQVFRRSARNRKTAFNRLIA